VRFVIDAATLASINFLLGLAIVTIYKGTRIINFALPGVMLFTAYLTVTVSGLMPLPLALLLGLGVAALLGAATFYLGIYPILGRPTYVGILTTVAIGFMLESIVTIVWKAGIVNLDLPSATFSVAGQSIRSAEAAIWATAVIVGAAFGILYRYTRLGLWLAATADNSLLARHRGIPVLVVLLLSSMVAAALAYAVGLLLGARLGVTMALGSTALRGLVVALVGGLDSVPGAALAAIILAVIESAVVIHDPRLATVVPYVVLLFILVWRPWGLLGTYEEVERI